MRALSEPKRCQQSVKRFFSQELRDANHPCINRMLDDLAKCYGPKGFMIRVVHGVSRHGDLVVPIKCIHDRDHVIVEGSQSSKYLEDRSWFEQLGYGQIASFLRCRIPKLVEVIALVLRHRKHVARMRIQ